MVGARFRFGVCLIMILMRYEIQALLNIGSLLIVYIYAKERDIIIMPECVILNFFTCIISLFI